MISSTRSTKALTSRPDVLSTNPDGYIENAGLVEEPERLALLDRLVGDRLGRQECVDLPGRQGVDARILGLEADELAGP